jgi:FkbM family methyltransferase
VSEDFEHHRKIGSAINASATDERPFTFRAGTCDENVYKSVVELNEYRLPDRFEADDVILDVGAHIGSFTKACLDRGAGKVFAFEPDLENFSAAINNLGNEILAKKVEIFPVALWRSDQPGQMLRHSGYPNENDEINTGGGGVIHRRREGKFVPMLPFDAVMQSLGTRGVRLLKLDCEYSEWPIVFGSRLLRPYVDAICGEYHEIRMDEMPDFAKVGASQFYTGSSLRYALEQEGFTVETEPTVGTNLGRFWAWKPECGFQESPTELAESPK